MTPSPRRASPRPLGDRLRPYPVAALAAWTLFSWLQRLGNAWGDEALSTAGKVAATVPVAVFTALGIALAVVVLRHADPDLGATGRRAVQAAVVWTVGYWVVRLPFILLHTADERYTVGFKVVHAGLAVIAWGLSAWAWRSVGQSDTTWVRRRRQMPRTTTTVP